jgi:hypothetical protein
MIRRIEPVRDRIEAHLSHPKEIEAVLKDGSARARTVAAATMVEVRDAMHLPTL